MRKSLVGVTTLAVLLCGTELFLRACSPVFFADIRLPVDVQWQLVHQPSHVPGLTYELRPGAQGEIEGHSLDINSQGMRDDEPLPEDTPGLCRIAVLGDSIAFGWKMPAESSFSTLLEQDLRTTAAEGCVIDVLNFAVTGYSTRDEVHQFRGKVAAFDPDLVVVAYCLNDPLAGMDQPLPRFFMEPKWWQYSHLTRFVAKQIHDRRVRTLGGGDYYRYAYAEEGPEWPTVVAAFDQLQDMTRELDIPVLVVIFPWVREERWEDYPYAAIHEQVARCSADHGFQVVDLLPAYAVHAPSEVAFGTYDPHPTALGHAIASEETARAIRRILSPETMGAPPLAAPVDD